MSMNGEGIIILKIGNHDFHEHSNLNDAKREAHRLAGGIGGKFVVYVPVTAIERTPPTSETPVTAWRGDDDELPF